MSFSPVAPKPPAIKRISVKEWMKGTVTAFDDGRTPSDGLRSSGNVILNQDGTVGPRPSLTSYGPQPTGTVLGEISEFKVVNGLTTTNYLISVQVVSGVASVYIAKGEDTSWTVCSGKTYSTTDSCHFCQVGNKVLIMNSSDTLSYLDLTTVGSTNTIVPFTALTTPSAPTVANNGSTNLTTTPTLNIYYAITANSTVGETIGSASTTLQINTDRDLWNPSTQSLKISWSAVTSAKSYNLYMAISAPGGSPTLYLIKSNIDSNTLSFIDDGSLPQDTTHPIPTTNSTAGPRVTRGTVINGRVFLVGDADNPYYVRFGGDFGFELDFSPANGGGFTPVGNGTKEIPVKVMPFRDGKGTAQITVLCQGTNGRGKRYLLTPDSLTVGSTTISFFDVTEDNGQDGTDSPDGVIPYQDSLWYPSRDGFKTTGTKPQLQNVLSTDRISNTIQSDIKLLSTAHMDGAVGLGFEGRLYWALPVQSTSNNEIWVLDLDRGGAWMKPWNVSADWMLLYNDNSGNSHFLVLSNNQIFEFSYNNFTSDNGTPFSTRGQSGLVTFSPDGRNWGKLIELIFTILKPRGTIDFVVYGKTDDSSFEQLGTTEETYSTTQTVGWSALAWSTHEWSVIASAPIVSGDTSVDVIVDVGEECQWFEYAWGSSAANVNYQISDVIAVYVDLGVRDLA